MKLADSTLALYRRQRAIADSLAPSRRADSIAAASTIAVDSIDSDDDEMRSEIDLFNAAALSILYLQRAGAARSLLSFWSSERPFLGRYLPEVFFQELETIYTDRNRQAEMQ
jgi:hypothetical protein